MYAYSSKQKHETDTSDFDLHMRYCSNLTKAKQLRYLCL